MYRWASPDDKPQIMALWAIDFESYEPYYSWYFDNVYRPGLTLCDYQDNTLAAALQLAPYTLSLNGEELPVCYVVGVITAPAFRGQGRGSALMEKAHQYIDQQGYQAALLYTHIPQFYRPFGYRHRYFQQTLCLPVTQGAPCPANAEDMPVQEGDIPAIDHIYRAMTARYEGYILRNERNWQIYLGEQACDKGRILYLPRQAYVLYTIDEDKLHVTELGFTDEAAARAGLEAAQQKAYEAKASQLIWHGPSDAPQIFSHIPASYWQPRPFVMVRSQKNFTASSGLLWINEYT